MQVPQGVEPNGRRSLNPHLIATLARAHRWRARIEAGLLASVAELAREEVVTAEQIERELALAYLAPNIARDLIFGEIDLSIHALAGIALPLDWGQQVDVVRA
jgi:hypothetical protein